MTADARQPKLAIADSPAGPIPDSELCRQQLARMIGSDDLDATDRQRRFLSYVVEEALAGRAERIKAYSVATEVFGRDAAFDPQSDPIVRVEAGQLRRALDRYYLQDGSGDPVQITIPKGGYAPTFAWRDPTDRPALRAGVADGTKQRWRRGRILAVSFTVAALVGVLAIALLRPPAMLQQPDIPRLLVQPFEDLTQTGQSRLITQGLTQEVVSQISKFKDIVVVAADAQGNPLANASAEEQKTLRYVLSGSVDIDADDVRLQARIVSQGDGAVIWANTYSGDLTVARLTAIEGAIARQVATTLAQPYGVIFQADSSRQMAAPPEDWSAYACTLSYYAYRITLDPQTHTAIRACLEDAVARFPTYATAWALLSQTYIDELRFRFASDHTSGPDVVDRALTAARKAVALDPTNIRGLQAEMFALYFSGQMESAISVGENALALNPNDTELMGELGYRLLLYGEWDRGCALVKEARTRNPGPFGYYETALALCAYQKSDFEAAAIWIRKSPMTDNPQYHAIAAAILGEMGDPAAIDEIEWLRENAPTYFTQPRKELAYRVRRKEDIDRFLASLQKAGQLANGP